MPIPNAKYRFKKISPTMENRLTFVGNKVVEVTPFYKKDGKFVKGHTRKIK